jgi:hypothetical protein
LSARSGYIGSLTIQEDGSDEKPFATHHRWDVALGYKDVVRRGTLITLDHVEVGDRVRIGGNLAWEIQELTRAESQRPALGDWIAS